MCEMISAGNEMDEWAGLFRYSLQIKKNSYFQAMEGGVLYDQASSVFEIF